MNFRDTSRSTNEDDVVDLGSIHLGVLENLLDGVESGTESDGVDLLESSSGDGRGEVGSLHKFNERGSANESKPNSRKERDETYLEQRINLNRSLRNTRKRPLRPLTSGPQPPKRPGVLRNIQLGLLLEVLLEVLQKGVVKVFSSQVGVSSSSFDSEDSTRDGEKGDIESSSSQVENEDELLLLGLFSRFSESVGDGGGSGLVDDSENVEAGDSSGVLFFF